MPATRLRSFWQFLRPLLPPFVLGALILMTLREPLTWWLYGEEIYDEEALREWIREARVYQTLPELAQQYIDMVDNHRAWSREIAKGDPEKLRILKNDLDTKQEEIQEHLKALGNPPTKMYPGQLPLFPIIYRLTVHFADGLELPPISWDSELPRQEGQYRQLRQVPLHPQAHVNLQYHLHAYMQRQFQERQEVTRRFLLSGLGLFFAVLAFLWIYFNQWREKQRHRQRQIAQQQLNEAERLRLGEELRRQEAERRGEEAERLNLELKSQIFANIGIMAGSYAHNIKNLLVRPNDLLRRCLEERPNHPEQDHMLREVKQTLGTVTERLQQILQTVRRDPTQAEKVRLDLNGLVREMHATWVELAGEKWKLELELDLHPPLDGQAAPLWIRGDASHLQQAVENLLFNARDATFEMRNYLRDKARKMSRQEAPLRGESRGGAGGAEHAESTALGADVRQALIAAAAWKGKVVFRTRLQENLAILEVQDNGIGMTEEVRRRCIETHFSTKRNNALFAGMSAGMGLGLSFVMVILEHHGAHLEIDSQSLEGATFRVRFPRAEA